MELGRIYKNVSVDEFHVKRVSDTYICRFSFDSAGNTISLSMYGIRDSENLCELLEADRIWLEKSETSDQLEFGKYTLGISGEAFTEVIFDALVASDS